MEEQIKRICRMEELFDSALNAIKKFPLSFEKFEEIQKSIAILTKYYSSADWKQDYADDEAGLLPMELKRGVLSEDGLWNLLSDWRELEAQILTK